MIQNDVTEVRFTAIVICQRTVNPYASSKLKTIGVRFRISSEQQNTVGFLAHGLC